jgi:hypothetical protein
MRYYIGNCFRNGRQLLYFYLLWFLFISVEARSQVYDSDTADWHRADSWVIGFIPAEIFALTDSAKAKDSSTALLLDPPFGSSACLNTSNICNTAGVLQFFTSISAQPCDITGKVLKGWENVNSPFGSKFFYGGFADLFPQLSIILPKQGTEYYVICGNMSDALYTKYENTNDPKNLYCDNLNYYVVDMALNNGLGEVTEHNTVIHQGSMLGADRMSAVRHANGRDWWLVKAHKTKQQLFTFLVTAQGITLHDSSVHASEEFTKLYIRGQSCFSPDGTTFAMVHDDYAKQAAYVYDFDRCSGLFSNYQKIKLTIPRLDDATHGVSFSPDSKMLYVASYLELNQIELTDTSINRISLIAGEQPEAYYLLGVANNGHLYVGNFDAVSQHMSYVKYPNRKGAACEFIRYGLKSDSTYMQTPPNVPNYRLGALKGSPCDTVDKAPVPPAPVPQAWALYPNPVSEQLYIAVPDSTALNVSISIYNSTGQLIARQQLAVNAQHVASVNIGQLSKGVYVLKANGVGSKFVGKFVKD